MKQIVCSSLKGQSLGTIAEVSFAMVPDIYYYVISVVEICLLGLYLSLG